MTPKSTDTRGGSARHVRLELHTPTWDALEEQAAELSMSLEELVGFSVLYYLADRDSGRTARQLPLARGGLHGDHPLQKLLDD